MASGNTQQAEDLMRAAQATGGSIKNSSARRKFLEDQERSKVRALIGEKTKARIAKMQVQNTSNPEAGYSLLPDTKREISASGTAPFGVGSAIPSYQLPYQKPSGPTEQPFGMTTPAIGDSGVDFSSISPYNIGEFALPQITQSPASQEAFSKLTAKQKDEILSKQISSLLKTTGKGLYRGGKGALKAILEGASAINN
jgi:hypothetical protein